MILRIQQLRKPYGNGVMYYPFQNREKGYDLLIEMLGAVTVVSEVARLYWNDGEELLKRIADKKFVPSSTGKVKKIGIYYHRMRNGGVEKVLSKLLYIWKEMGYEIILFTDEKPTEDDYQMPEMIERICTAKFCNVHWCQI